MAGKYFADSAAQRYAKTLKTARSLQRGLAGVVPTVVGQCLSAPMGA